MDLSVFEAVKTGDPEKVLEALHNGHAVDTPHLLSAQDLLSLRVWPIPTPEFYTALQWLAMFHCKNADPSIVQTLLESGANTEIRNSKGETPLMVLATCNERCCAVQRMVTMTQLLDHGANVDALAEDDETPLFASMYSNSESQVRLLLRMGADVNRTIGGHSMLQWTSIMGVVDITIVLVEYGAYPGLSMHDALGNIILEARIHGKTAFADEMERSREEMRLARLDILDVLAQGYDFYDRPE